MGSLKRGKRIAQFERLQVAGCPAMPHNKRTHRALAVA